MIGVLTGGNAILVASVELSLVRALRAAAHTGIAPKAAARAVGDTPAAPSSGPHVTGPRCTLDRSKACGGAGGSAAVLGGSAGRPAAVTEEARSSTGLGVNPAGEALLPMDPGSPRIRPGGELRTYQLMRRAMERPTPESPAPAREVVKIELRRTDTYRKGAVLDIFC